MKTFTFLSLFILVQIIQVNYGLSSDGMLSCAWGSHKRSVTTSDKASSSSLRDNVKFLVYNRDNAQSNQEHQIYLHDVDSLFTGHYDTKKLTKIMIHGYKSSSKKSACRLIKDAFLEVGDFNVIVVDWSKAQHWGVIPLAYPAVVSKVKHIADYVAKMITFLEQHGNLNLTATTMVGHSLGAHVAGIAGYKLQNKIYRIVGLDPAAPSYSHKDPDERLSKEDAMHVEVIHTDIEQCGLNRQLGHYDFYPNSGEKQPGCTTYKCSHGRSYRFFAESISTTKGFFARLCSDWKAMQVGVCTGEKVLMGGLDRSTIPEGIYYVKTNDVSPYALGDI